MHQRRKAREIALQVLYELDVLGIDAAEGMELFWSHFEAPEDARPFAALLIAGTWNNRKELDDLISGCSENWTISRMSKVDKNILRMAIYELLHCPDIPPKVTLNEAIDLGKIYGTENSGSFVNGILDAVYIKLNEKDQAQENASIAQD